MSLSLLSRILDTTSFNSSISSTKIISLKLRNHNNPFLFLCFFAKLGCYLRQIPHTEVFLFRFYHRCSLYSYPWERECDSKYSFIVIFTHHVLNICSENTLNKIDDSRHRSLTARTIRCFSWMWSLSQIYMWDS